MINNYPLNDRWGKREPGDSSQILHITKENKIIYLAVVWFLGTIVLMSIAGIITLTFFVREVPQALIALGSVAVGVLGSLFTNSK